MLVYYEGLGVLLWRLRNVNVMLIYYGIMVLWIMEVKQFIIYVGYSYIMENLHFKTTGVMLV